MVTPLADLHSTPSKPADLATTAGSPLKRTKSSFEPTEWLVLAPFAVEKDENKTLNQPGLETDPTLWPAAGDRSNGLVWKVAHIDQGINFFEWLGPQDSPKIAYLSASIYSPREAEFGFRCEGNHGNWLLFLNGKPENGWDQARHQLKRGWNRLLLKVILRARESDSRVEPELYPFPGPDLHYDTTNIAWTRPMPGPSYAMPLIVGGRIFVTSEPSDLLCLDKLTGKPLWMQCDTLWHAAIDSEPLSSPRLSLVEVSDRTLTFAANTALDPVSARVIPSATT